MLPSRGGINSPIGRRRSDSLAGTVFTKELML
jgi:hypothetical protein